VKKRIVIDLIRFWDKANDNFIFVTLKTRFY